VIRAIMAVMIIMMMIMTILMIIIIRKPIYNEKKVKSRKILKVEKPAKSSEIQSLQR
jgi:hypothetical protein